MDNTILRQQVLDFLRSESIMSAAINNSDRPVSTILLFVIDDDFTLYFATHKDSIKAVSLTTDNKISMSVWAHDKMMIQGSGVATEITDLPTMEKVLDRLADSAATIEGFWPPVLQIKGNNYAIYSVKINWLRMLDLSNKKIHVMSPFNQII